MFTNSPGPRLAGYHDDMSDDFYSANQDTRETDDLRGQMRLSNSGLVRWVFVVLGFVFLVFGIIGVVLPILPTTPFLLLAAACFARGSERFYVALLQNRFFGGFIRDWRDGKGIPLRTKIWVIGLLWVAMGVTILFIVPLVAVKVVLAVIALGVTWLIASQPTKKSSPEV